MFMVYWTQHYATLGNQAESCLFGSDEMGKALSFMAQLREMPTASFIVMASENPNSVGKQGVAAAGSDYNWTKRRNNERDPNVAISRRKLYNSTDEQEVPLDEE